MFPQWEKLSRGKWRVHSVGNSPWIISKVCPCVLWIAGVGWHCWALAILRGISVTACHVVAQVLEVVLALWLVVREAHTLHVKSFSRDTSIVARVCAGHQHQEMQVWMG